jgi:lysine 2,3-aminomutase
MWPVEGLTHRYPTKVLAELVSTCPLYCGHCTRMDLVGPSTPMTAKYHFVTKAPDRRTQMLEYVRATPSVRDVVVSGGDLANLPWPRLEEFLDGLLEIDNVRDIRLATKGLMSLPQHWLSDEVRRGVQRVAAKASARGVALAMHTHVNAANQVTETFTRAARAMAEAGIHHIRNQGVLLRGVNATPDALLDLCFAVLDGAGVIPYYFYMCDIIPNCEHWRTSLAEAQELQHAMMGYLPGFATPRIVCDVPYLGKRWVHQCVDYDRERGISYWTKNYRTPLEAADEGALLRRYEYYDPVYLLPESGQEWWRGQQTSGCSSAGRASGIPTAV